MLYKLSEDNAAFMSLSFTEYLGLGAKGLRDMLFDKCELDSLYCFENRRPGLFPAVHSSYKPIVITFKKGGRTTKFPCAFYLHTQEDLAPKSVYMPLGITCPAMPSAFNN